MSIIAEYVLAQDYDAFMRGLTIRDMLDTPPHAAEVDTMTRNLELPGVDHRMP